MNIALVLFALGVIMIVSGYTNQVSPKCDQDIKVKIVPRNVFDEIAENSDLNISDTDIESLDEKDSEKISIAEVMTKNEEKQPA